MSNSKFSLKSIKDIAPTDRDSIDRFICDPRTNGEFINTLKYLSYHPLGRFIDDSVFVIDTGSKEIRGVMMAASTPDNKNSIVSHPGTSFAGPIVSRKMSIAATEEIIDLMLTYYENRYNVVQIVPKPEFFSIQPMEFIPYFFLKRGYAYEMVGLSNVIDISMILSEEDIFKLYASDKRNQTRKVLKSSLFRFTEDFVIRKDAWDNLTNTLMEKHHVSIVHTLKEIQLLKEMFPDNISVYYADTTSEEYGALGLTYNYKDVLHTQYLDTNYSFSGEYPNLLLMYNLILRAREKKYSRFSIGISTENAGEHLNYGLYNYKAGYGGGSIVQAKYVWRK